MSVTKGDWERFCDLIRDARKSYCKIRYNGIDVIGVPRSETTQESVIVLRGPADTYEVAGSYIERKGIKNIDLFMFNFTVTMAFSDAYSAGAFGDETLKKQKAEQRG